MIADKFNEKKASILYDAIMSVPAEQLKAVDSFTLYDSKVVCDKVPEPVTQFENFMFSGSLTGYSSPSFTYEASISYKPTEYNCSVHGRTTHVSHYPTIWGQDRSYCSNCIADTFDRMGISQVFACV